MFLSPKVGKSKNDTSVFTVLHLIYTKFLSFCYVLRYLTLGFQQFNITSILNLFPFLKFGTQYV